MPLGLAGAFSPTGSNNGTLIERGLIPTGLKPLYPSSARCPAAGSTFASSNRTDGSRRAQQFYGGRHGGMDIPVDEGTPILAVADGTVVQKSEGRFIGGLGLVLQHAPEETGLPVWTYTEYKHLRELPSIEIGTKVKKGERIAYAGDTGTTGGYYGEEGFSHLHLSAYFSRETGYFAGRLFAPIDGYWLDPLALFRGAPLHSKELRDLPENQKAIAIAYTTGDGGIVPPDAKIIWPFACRPF